MDPVLKLGDFYVSDFVKEQPIDCKKYSLDLYRDLFLPTVRLQDVAPNPRTDYYLWYKESRAIVKDIEDRIRLKDGDIWLDITGTLTTYIPEKCSKRFEFGDFKAKVITCIDYFDGVENYKEYIQQLLDSLEDNGLLVLQMNYTPLMIEQLAFDSIGHHRVYYYDLISIHEAFCVGNQFKVVDAVLNDVGGSFRIYLQKKDAADDSFGTQPFRDVCSMRIRNMLQTEAELKLDDPTAWRHFGEDLRDLKKEVVKFIKDANKEGKKVWAYGASRNGNMLLQYFDLNATMIEAIADDNKAGLRTIGTDIPVLSLKEMRAADPDYLLVLPWQYIAEIQDSESEYLKNGGALIVACPEFKVIKYEDCIL